MQLRSLISRSILGVLVLAVGHLGIISASAQNQNRILHLKGTQIINGISVTVSSKGNVDSLHYCGEDTGPYYLGYNYKNKGAKNGSYTFSFSEPADEVIINLSAMSHSNTYGEEARIFVNGTHYKVTAIGSNNGCGEAPVYLTPSGDIRPCINCSASGTNGIKIQGPINSITIECIILSGEPMGFVAGVWFKGKGSNENIMTSYTTKIGENSAGLGMELVISGDLENAELRLNDINLVPIQISYKLTEKKMIILDISALTPGEYILQIKKNDIIEKQKIFIP